MAAIRSLPLFPLDLVLYPSARQPLHIFEQRYKDLVAYCLEEDAPFGMVLATGAGDLEDVGSTAEIEKVARRYEDGRLDLISIGRQRFRIEEVREGERSYLTADVRMLPDTTAPEVPREMRERVITQHMKLLELAGYTPRPTFYEDVEYLSFVLAQNSALQTPQQQTVLELPSEQERLAFLMQHFETLLPRVEEQQSTRERIRSDGHFRDFPPEDDR